MIFHTNAFPISDWAAVINLMASGGGRGFSVPPK